MADFWFLPTTHKPTYVTGWRPIFFALLLGRIYLSKICFVRVDFEKNNFVVVSSANPSYGQTVIIKPNILSKCAHNNLIKIDPLV